MVKLAHFQRRRVEKKKQIHKETTKPKDAHN
jgi:hypothetical protein